ncbi:MAG: DUF624 domain-containing protein [Clostridiaceae bacterium]|nr:DUF624 domain-containing protein [Clostridiaceae bacterium]
MASKKEFGEGPMYTLFNYIMWIFASNMYFMLCNILLVIYLLSFGKDISSTYVLLYLALLPMGPALAAIYATVGKIIREKDISITSYFFKSYKSNFKQAFILGFIECTAILVSIVDIKYFSAMKYGNYFTPFFIALIVLIFIIGLYAFPLLSRFYLKTTDIIKFSFVYSIKKIHITFFILTSIVCAGFILYTIPNIAIFFIFGGICYVIMFYEIKILNELESKSTKTESEEEL